MNPEIKNFEFSHRLRASRKSRIREINEKGLWLFLNALACMGLPDSRLCILALWLCLMFFLYFAKSRYDQIQDDKAEIKREAIDEVRAASEVGRDLIAEVDREFSKARIIAHTWVYWAAAGFLALCVYLTAREINRKANQTSEPTRTAVMPAAGASVTPASLVAHIKRSAQMHSFIVTIPAMTP